MSERTEGIKEDKSWQQILWLHQMLRIAPSHQGHLSIADKELFDRRGNSIRGRGRGVIMTAKENNMASVTAHS